MILFFKKVDRDGDGREQNNSPVVCPQLDEVGMVQFTTDAIIDDFYVMNTRKVRLK